MNVLTSTDSYKSSHFLQYPPDLRSTYHYVEPRYADPAFGFKRALFFGLQAWLQDLNTSTGLEGSQIDNAAFLLNTHGEPFPINLWKALRARYPRALPVRIRAVPEGTLVPLGCPVVTIETTDPEFPWLAGWLETSLLRGIWYPTTVATLSYECRQILRQALAKSCDEPEKQIDFRLHDFGARGVSSSESAGLGGLAHLVNFKGTDTVEALLAGRRHYGADMAGFSIPAAEHSTILAWGRDREFQAYEHAVAAFAKPGATFAVVCDTYDVWDAIGRHWIKGGLLERVKQAGATVVLRLDSGDPASSVRHALEVLSECVGYSHNQKSYIVLPPHVRLIQGDGMNLQSISRVCDAITRRGYSVENVAFGMGGKLLQGVNRDTLGWAMKLSSCTYADRTVRDVAKTPVGDSTKASKAGRVVTVRRGDMLVTGREGDSDDIMQTVYNNGPVNGGVTLDEVRALVRAQEDAL